MNDQAEQMVHCVRHTKIIVEMEQYKVVSEKRVMMAIRTILMPATIVVKIMYEYVAQQMDRLIMMMSSHR